MMLVKSLVALAVAFLLWHIGSQLWRMGYHKYTINHYPGPCRPLEGIDRGSEDGVLLPSGLTLITSGLRFVSALNNPVFDGVKGQIYLFDFNHLDVAPVPLLKDSDMDLELFNPHGASHWLDPESGEIYFYVVNHKPKESVVERFLFSPEHRTLTHQKTFGSGDPTFRYLNDLVMVGKDKFYVTSMMWYRSMLEHYSGVPWGTVTYFDGAKGHLAVSSGLRGSNGIGISPDGRYLYVGTIGGQELISYAISEDNSLNRIASFPMYQGVDNLFVDAKTGDVWMAGHPVVGRVAQQCHDPISNTSPSQVLVASMEDGRLVALRDVLMDDGNLISASSVAIVRGNTLLVGTVNVRPFLCELRYY